MTTSYKHIIWLLGGSVLFSVLSAIQKLLLGVSMTPQSFFFPALFGGVSGLLAGHWKCRLSLSDENLIASEERYRALYTNTPAMLHSINSEGHLLNVSRHWLSTLGYEEKEVVGRKFTDFLTSGSRRLAENVIFPQFFREGSVEDVPYQMLKKNGAVIDVVLSATSQHTLDGRFLHSLAVVTDVTDRNRAEAQLHNMAYCDILTGLPNRFLFQERLNQVLSKPLREKRTVSILFIGLDCFRGINNSLGYLIGDHLLKAAGERLKGCMEDGDTIARLVGDEFVAFTLHRSDERGGRGLAEMILDSLTAPFHIDGQDIYCSASIGISTSPEDGDTVDTLLGKADIAMNEAKRQGDNVFRIFTPEMNARVSERYDLENRLRKAIEADELTLHYQPQIDLKSGRIVGVEALMRWRLSDGSFVSPAKFIPLAEESGLILPMGEWCLKNACAQAAAWRAAGYPPLKMAVNISSRQFAQTFFLEKLEEIVAQTTIDPSLLELELTESILMENAGDVIMTLTDLKTRGFLLAVDDFGTGYSSLSYLKNFPIDRLKIAQEFMREIPYNAGDVSIVEAIIAMARSLGLTVIAEGVENIEQLDFLQRLGCEEIQGYIYSKPLPPDEFIARFGNFLMEGTLPDIGFQDE